jgi:hypothetical protein
MSNIDKKILIEKLIFQLPNKYCDDYFEWVSIGHFIFNELGNDGFTLFDKWSQLNNKYHPQSVKSLYEYFNSHSNFDDIYKYNIDILSQHIYTNTNSNVSTTIDTFTRHL